MPLLLGLAGGAQAQSPPCEPEISISGGAAITEGGLAEFTLRATCAPSDDLPVRVNVDDPYDFIEKDDRDDFDGKSRTGEKFVTILEGQTSKTFTVQTHDDRVQGISGKVQAWILGRVNGGYRLSPTMDLAEVTVNDNDGVGTTDPPPSTTVASFAPGSSSAGEGDSTHNVTVSLSPAPQSAITLSYGVSGTATASDFTITGSGSISVSSGATSVNIPVAIIDDTDTDPGETVVLTLTGGSGYTVGNPGAHTLTIVDNEGPPILSISGPASANEGNAGTTDHTFTVNLSRPLSSGSVVWEVCFTGTAMLDMDGTFDAGDDYQILSGMQPVVSDNCFNQNFSSLSSSLSYNLLSIRVKGDTVNEPGETVAATLKIGDQIGTSPAVTLGTSTATHTIINDDGGTRPSPPPPPAKPTVSTPLAKPTVSLSVSPNPVTEGQAATVTAMLSRALSGAVTIPLALTAGTAETGDFGALASITIAGGQVSGTGTVSTVRDDDTDDETFTVALGSLPPEVQAGSPSSVGVTIRDLDKAGMVSVSVSDASAAEGGAVAFTVRVSPPHPEAISLIWTRTHGTTGADDFASGAAASGTVTVAANAGSAAFSVATADDRIDEDTETFTVTLSPSSGSLPNLVSFSDDTATGRIADDDNAGIRLSPLRIAEEGGKAEYTVVLTSQPEAPVTVTAESSDEDAVTVSPDILTFAPGDWSAPQTVTATAGADRGRATVTHTASSSDGKYAAVAPVQLSVRLERDPVSAATAWLVRFARTHVGHVLDGIAERMRAAPAPGGKARLAGRAMEPGAEQGAASPAAGGPVGSAAGEPLSAGISSGGESRAVAAREALAGSSFALTGKEGADGSVWSVWGRGAWSRFDGREGALALDGDAATAVLGVDRRQGRWLTGLAFAHSTGEGGYSGADEGRGDLDSGLTTVTPWASLELSERITAWGALGYGRGELKLTPKDDSAATADTETLLAALGARGAVIEAPAAGGFGLTLVSDALWLEADSDRAGEALAATSSDVSRLRMGVEGTWDRETGDAGRLGARLDLALRHDGGDAERGFGAEVGGGVSWADPARGLSLGVEGRGLMAHDASSFRDKSASASLSWDRDPVAGRGPSLGLRQDWGGPSSGGPGRLPAAETPLESTGGARRLSAEAGWGFPALERRLTAGPRLGYGLSNAARDYSLGWRLAPAGPRAPDLVLDAALARRESRNAPAEHSIGLELRMKW